MPKAFPMGSMENPLLSFVSQTTIVGDKSQEYVYVHDVAHYWTGNIVTMQNWEDFWLNEGFTVFIERHVDAQLWDVNTAMTNAFIGNYSLSREVNIIGSNIPITYRSMHPVLAGDNPDNSFSIIPFEKGFQLLQYIEDSVVGYNIMEDFITYYIENNYL
jgi:leukotriene-A4 hydrolase